jgi:4-aminobutyrate aminotransferase/(S)-3-amino-2-methylpropionate transaminase
VRIANIRGRGFMVGFDILDADGKPDGAEAKAVCARALEAGLILLTCGTQGEAIRVLAPLTIEDAIFEEGLAALERALNPGAPASSAETLKTSSELA